MATMAETRAIGWSIFWKTAFSVGAIAVLFHVMSMGIFFAINPSSRTTFELFKMLLAWFEVGASFIAYFVAFNYFFANAVGKTIGGKRLELVKERVFRERQ